MLKRLSQAEIAERDDVHMFRYALNNAGVKTLEFGAIIALVAAVMVYPLTRFEPPAWMILPAFLAAIAIAMLSYGQYLRAFAKRSFIAYDSEYFFCGTSKNSAVCIPWEKITLKSSGLAAPGKGAKFDMDIDGERIPVKLFTNLVCIPQFETVLFEILTHIKKNDNESK